MGRTWVPTPQPMYRVWCAEYEENDERAEEYGAIDVERAAQLHASRFYSDRDGHECSWPLVFNVIDPEDGKTYAVSVDLVMVAEFRPAPKKELP